MKRTATVAAALALTFGGGAAGATVSSYMSPSDTANPTAQRGCVIRFDTLTESGNYVAPRIHANETHHCVGVTSVQTVWDAGWERGDLLINNTGGPETVVTVTVDPDETLTARGISCGASGGGQVTRIRCYDRDGNKVDTQSLDMYGPTSNLWVGWTMWTPDV